MDRLTLRDDQWERIAFDNMKDAKEKLNFWIEYYNHERPHSSLNDQTPNEVYEGIKPLSLAT